MALTSRLINTPALNVPITGDSGNLLKALSAAKGGVAGFGSAVAGVATTALKGLTIAAGAATVAVGGATAAITKLTFTAARVSELEAVIKLLGERAGWTSQEIDNNVKSITELGIRTDVALELMSQFARYQLDVADATMLARTAQDVAVLSMQDSSDALNALMYGILTQNVRVFRNAGLNIQAGKAMDVYAKSIGKTTDELSTNERMQAMLVAIQKEGIKVAGAYETAMQEPAKLFRSLGRHFWEAGRAIGNHFLPAFRNVIEGVTRWIKQVRELLEEGQPLYRFFAALGRIATTVTGKLFGIEGAGEGLANILDKLADMAEGAADAIEGFFARIEKGKEAVEGVSSRLAKFGQMVYDRVIKPIVKIVKAVFDWGVNIAKSLAEGIAKGAATALTAAMNFIGSILKTFLAPGSPPMIAPGLWDWGEEAGADYAESLARGAGRGIAAATPTITENLKAFGLSAVDSLLSGLSGAELDVFEVLTGSIQQVFGALEALGEYKPNVEFLKSLQVEVARALSGEGGAGVMESLFENLRKAGGRFGDRLEQLARLQFQLVNATNAVAAAEERLNAARTGTEDAATNVEKIIEQYNELRARGADAEALAAKRDEYDLARATLDQAEEEEAAAKRALVAAEEQISPLEERYRQQERILAQLAQMASMQEEAATASVAAAGSVKGLLDDIEEEVESTVDSIIDDLSMPELTSTLGSVKDEIKEAFTTAFDPVFAKWATFKTQYIDPLITAWDNLMTKIEEMDLQVLESIGEKFGNIFSALEDIYNTVKDGVIEGSMAWWDRRGDEVREVVDEIGKSFGRLGEALLEVFNALLPEDVKLQGLNNLYQIVYILTQLGWTKFLSDLEEFSKILGWIADKAEKIPLLIELAQWILVPQRKIKEAGSPGASEQSGVRWAENMRTSLIGPTGEVTLMIADVQTEFGKLYVLPDNLSPAMTTIAGQFTTLRQSVADTTSKGSVPEMAANILSNVDDLTQIPVTLETPLQDTADAFADRASDILTSVQTMRADVLTEFDGLVADATGFLTSADVIADFEDAGEKLIKGLRKGVKDEWPNLKQDFEIKIREIVLAVLKELKIGSPSKVFEDIGIEIPRGLSKGIVSGFAETERSIKSALNTAINASVTGIPQMATVASSPTDNRQWNMVVNNPQYPSQTTYSWNRLRTMRG